MSQVTKIDNVSEVSHYDVSKVGWLLYLPYSSYPTEVEKVTDELGLGFEREGRVVFLRPSQSGSTLDTDQLLQTIRGESPWSDSWVTSWLVDKLHPLISDRDLLKHDLDRLIVITTDRRWEWCPHSSSSSPERLLLHR